MDILQYCQIKCIIKYSVKTGIIRLGKLTQYIYKIFEISMTGIKGV